MKHKGVVVEIAPKNRVIVMTPDGEFIRIPFKKHMHVGQEIRYTPKKTRLNVLQAGLVATLFLALVGTWPIISGRLAPSGATAAFVMTVDINPSFELQISDEHRVLAVEGLNRDGKNLASQLAVVGENLQQALVKIGDRLQKEGYLGSDKKRILVTIASQKRVSNETFEVGIREIQRGGSASHQELQGMAEEVFDAIQLAEVRVWQVPSSLLNEARLAGITPSRYLAIHLPALFAIPQRTAVRLTMNDIPEYESVPSGRVREQAIARELPRSALTPAQWTKQNLTSFPMVAEVKGDFRPNR